MLNNNSIMGKEIELAKEDLQREIGVNINIIDDEERIWCSDYDTIEDILLGNLDDIKYVPSMASLIYEYIENDKIEFAKRIKNTHNFIELITKEIDFEELDDLYIIKKEQLPKAVAL